MLSKEEVQHVALLARVGVTENEAESYREKLSGVLDFFRELEMADMGEITVSRSVIGKENVLRGDIVRESASSEKALIMDNVPEAKDRYVKVKSVF
jgi:aspartyl-tRNA(Asn)/glutamyl-tRNA(Gln) amidotransferase subunit C